MAKKHSFTLIEVVIALSLMGIISGVLFSYWRDLNIKSARIEQVKATFLQRESLQIRLSEIFSLLTDDLTATEDELTFRYDNGVDPNPHLCGEIEGRLFFESGVLFLESKSLEQDEMRLESLMREVKNFRFDLFEVDEEPIHLRLFIDDITFPFFLPKAHKEIPL